MTYETFNKHLEYNPVSGDLVWKVTTNGRALAGSLAGSIDTGGYVQVQLQSKLHSAHRVVWLLHHKEWPDGQIDHINGDRKDNRIGNLRDVTDAENRKNQKTPINNTSGAIGVSWAKQKGKWVTSIGTDGGRKHLGLFHTIFDAVCARKSAERLYGYHENHGRSHEF